MMTKEEVLTLLTTAKADLDVMDYGDGDIDVTVMDFEGFDDHWCEIMRDLEDEALVDRIFDTLRDNCVEFIEDFYTQFVFDGFTVQWGYASYDI